MYILVLIQLGNLEGARLNHVFHKFDHENCKARVVRGAIHHVIVDVWSSQVCTYCFFRYNLERIALVGLDD